MIAMLISNRKISRLLPLALLLSLSACGILPKREPIQIYAPAHVDAASHPEWPQADWSLLVAKPVASQLLDSERIGVRPTPGRVQVYQGASWSDSAPELLQTTLVRGFEDSQKILSVSRPGAGIRGQYQLLTELRSFESVYTEPGKPQAVVEVYAQLVHTADGQAVSARSFRETEPASGEGVPAVVDAFSRALDRLSTQVVGWTLSNGVRHETDAGKHSPSH